MWFRSFPPRLWVLVLSWLSVPEKNLGTRKRIAFIKCAAHSRLTNSEPTPLPWPGLSPIGDKRDGCPFLDSAGRTQAVP